MGEARGRTKMVEWGGMGWGSKGERLERLGWNKGRKDGLGSRRERTNGLRSGARMKTEFE